MTNTSRLTVLLLGFMLMAGSASATTVCLTNTPSTQGVDPVSSAGAAVLGLLGGSLVVFGAIRIKDTATLAAKFVQRAGAAAGDYRTGVEQAGQDWETGARGAESSYEQGVQEAIQRKRFARGIAAAGAQKYVGNAVKLGAVRYAPGVQNAQDAWARGVTPALEKIKSLTLPPRGPRRSPQNQQRANMVALELGKLVDGQ